MPVLANPRLQSIEGFPFHLQSQVLQGFQLMHKAGKLSHQAKL